MNIDTIDPLTLPSLPPCGVCQPLNIVESLSGIERLEVGKSSETPRCAEFCCPTGESESLSGIEKISYPQISTNFISDHDHRTPRPN